MRNKKSKKNDFEFGVVDGEIKSVSPDQAKNLYFEILNYQKKQKNGLLGEFDKNGNYSIKDDKILENLLLISKKFEDKQDNVVYASAKKGSFVLNFKIEFKIDLDFSSAELFLIETEAAAEENIKHVTKLDEYVAVSSATFKDDVFALWKIWKDEDVYEKNDVLFDYLNKQSEEFMFNRELTEILSQLYVVRILKILEVSGELGQKVIQEYKMFLEKKRVSDPDFHLSFANLKEVLDFYMVKNHVFDVILKNPEAVAVLEGYAQPIKRFKDKIPVVEINDDKKEEKKEAKKPEKKSAPTKAKGKAKAAGGKPSKIDLKFGGKTYKPLPSAKAPEKSKTKESKTPVLNENKKTAEKTPVLQKNIQTKEKEEVPIPSLTTSFAAADFLERKYNNMISRKNSFESIDEKDSGGKISDSKEKSDLNMVNSKPQKILEKNL